MARLTSKQLEETAAGLGLTFVGAFGPESFAAEAKLQAARLASWQERGFAAEMQYMRREPELFTALARFLPSVRSVMVFLIPYARGEKNELVRPEGYGRVARYAWGRDYHRVIPRRLKQLSVALRQLLPKNFPLEQRIFTDAVPLLERALAAHAGLGFVGKNTMLIRAGFGSYGFLAELLSNVEVEAALPEQIRGGCGSCSRCIADCPTEAIVAAHTLDASRCISYLSIEKRGAFSEWERSALGEWIFGCDICQEVCPFNHAPRNIAALEFDAAEGAGAFLSLREVLSLRSDEDFVKRFAGTPLMRSKREGLLRNAAAVAANTVSLECVSVMLDACKVEKSPLIRGEMLAALKRLQNCADGVESRRILNLLDGMQ